MLKRSICLSLVLIWRLRSCAACRLMMILSQLWIAIPMRKVWVPD